MSGYLVYMMSLGALWLVVLCWHTSQRAGKQHPRYRLVLLSISILITGCVYFGLQRSVGAEFALFLSLFHFSWVAWVFVATQARVKVKTTRPMTPMLKSVRVEKSRWYKLLVVILAGPLALFCSVLSSLLMSRLLIDELANQWVLTFILTPLVWGVLAIWFASDRYVLRPLVITLMLTLTSYGWIA